MPVTQVTRGGPKKTGVKPVAAGRLTGKTIPQRHRKIVRDRIRGITRPDIRRLARRGGIKRISAHIYNDARLALKSHLEAIIKTCVIFVEHRQAKTITVNDVIFSLRKLGRPIYGFDLPLPPAAKKTQKKPAVHDDEYEY